MRAMTTAADAFAETAPLRTLEQVFAGPSRAVFPGDVIIQDEYTHDVIFRATDGSALVFDST